MGYKYKGKYKTKVSPEELYEGFHDYIDFLQYESNEDGKDRIPSYAGLCDYLWISENTLANYSQYDEFQAVIQHINTYIVEHLQFLGVNKSNSRFIEYVLNNRFSKNWSNKQTIENVEVKSLTTESERKQALLEVEQDLKRLNNSTI